MLASFFFGGWQGAGPAACKKTRCQGTVPWQVCAKVRKVISRTDPMTTEFMTTEFMCSLMS